MFTPLIRWASGRGGRNRLSVFIYHRVLPEPDPLFPGEVDVRQFSRQLGWITRWFRVMPLPTAVQMLRQGNLPAGVAAITFDDGYADNLHQAAPILREHGACATLFVATGFLDGGCMWNDRVIEAVRRTSRATLNLPGIAPEPLPMEGIERRRRAVHVLIRQIKYLPAPEREAAVAQVVRSSGVALPDDLMLTTAELRRWQRMGNDVGGHTVNHPILAAVPDDVAEAEIAQGRDRLQDILDTRVSLFAYPNGRLGEDYLPHHVAMVQRLGFDAAFSTNWGVSGPGAPMFELPRFTPWDRSRTRFGARLVQNLVSRTVPVAV